MKNNFNKIAMASLAVVVFVASLTLSVESDSKGALNFTNNGYAQSSGSEGGGTPGGTTVPTACPTATITDLNGVANDPSSCNCTVSYSVVVSVNPYKLEIRNASFRGIENTCKSGSETSVCRAYACSSSQH